MRQRIALCDSDREYASRVASYVRESEFRKRVELTVCNNPSLLLEWAEKDRFDLYAIGIEYAEMLESLVGEETNVIWLSETDRERGLYGAPIVKKYDSAPGLIRTWLRNAGGREGAVRDARKQASISAVWSVGGGAGKTKLVSLLAGDWARRGRRLFVIGIDPGLLSQVEGAGVTFHDIGDWLFAIKSGKTPEISAVDAGEGASIHYFLPDSSYREWDGLGREEAGKLLDTAAAAFGCDAVLVDTDAGWSAFSEVVWSRAHALLCVSSAEELSLRKTDKWLREWPEWDEEAMLREKTLFVLNKCLPGGMDTDFPWTEGAFRLPYVPEWKQVNDQTDPMFQQALHRLAEELWSRCERQ